MKVYLSLRVTWRGKKQTETKVDEGLVCMSNRVT